MDGLNEYKIQINDVLAKSETIHADTLDEAIDIAIDLYLKEKYIDSYADAKARTVASQMSKRPVSTGRKAI